MKLQIVVALRHSVVYIRCASLASVDMEGGLMWGLDIYQILGRSFVGLAFLLALMAYFLLRRHLDKDPQPPATTIYAFMVFTFAIAALGFFMDWQAQNTIKTKAAFENCWKQTDSGTTGPNQIQCWRNTFVAQGWDE